MRSCSRQNWSADGQAPQGQAWPWQERGGFCPSQGYCQPGFCWEYRVKAGHFGGCRLVPVCGCCGVGQGHRRNKAPDELYLLAAAASGEVRDGFLPLFSPILVWAPWEALPSRSRMVPLHPQRGSHGHLGPTPAEGAESWPVSLWYRGPDRGLLLHTFLF